MESRRTRPHGGATSSDGAGQPLPICTRRELQIGVAFVALLTLIAFWPFLEGQTLSNIPSIQQLWAPWRTGSAAFFIYPQGDQATFLYPNIAFQTDAWTSGTIPMWNPFSYLGVPVLAHPALGVLYPVRVLLSLTVSPLVNHDLFLVLHIFGTGLFTFLFLKELRLRLAAALLGATAWMFASWSTSWMQTEGFLPTTCWLPAALLLIHRGVRNRSWRTAVAAGLPLALMAIGGNLQTAALGFVICGVWSAMLVAAPLVGPLLRSQKPEGPDVRRLTHPALSLGVGGALAAVTILPTVLSLDEGGRQAVPYPEFVSRHTIPVEEFAHVLSGGPPTTTTLFVSGVFVGVIPFLLAFIGFCRRRPGAALARWLAVGAFLVAIGAPAFTRIAYLFIPGLSRLNTTGYILWVFDLGLVILAAIGLDAVLGWAGELRKRVQWQRFNAELGRIVTAVVSILALTITAWQLIDYTREVNPPFTDRDANLLLYPKTPALRAMKRDQVARTGTEPQRMMAFNAMVGEPNLVFSIEDVGGYDIAPTARIRTLARTIQNQPIEAALTGGSFGSYLTIFLPDAVRYQLLPRVGVTTLIAGPLEAQELSDPQVVAPLTLDPIYVGADATVFDIAGEQPRAWVVHTAKVVCSEEEALRRFAALDFDHRSQMIVEPDQDLGRCGSTEQLGDGASVVANRDPVQVNGTAFTVDSESPGWLVMADAYAPGWGVTVNGKDAELLRANYALRAVEIPAGSSRVELEYRPPGLTPGATITALALVGVTVVGATSLFAWRRRRRGTPTAVSQATASTTSSSTSPT